MNELEMTAMQLDWFEGWRHKRRWTIVKEGDGTFSVHEHSSNGIAPPSTYVTPAEAVARTLQLMGITEPVAPQNWSESVCVGFVDTDGHKRIDLTPKK